jgi:hypothetical protein
MAEEEAVRPAGARAGSEVLKAAKALQRQRLDRVDEGIRGGVSGLRRWRLAGNRDFLESLVVADVDTGFKIV